MYLNNQTFYKQLLDWKQSGDEQIPDEIAKAIMEICSNLARCGRFAGYTWKEDMIGDAILTCIKVAKNFDPERSKNPFSYFTQIAYNCFRQFLNKEHLRLATIEEYKQVTDTVYGIDETEDDDYGHITESAKRYDTAFQKRRNVKKKYQKKSTAIDIENCFED